MHAFMAAVLLRMSGLNASTVTNFAQIGQEHNGSLF